MSRMRFEDYAAIVIGNIKAAPAQTKVMLSTMETLVSHSNGVFTVVFVEENETETMTESEFIELMAEFE